VSASVGPARPPAPEWCARCHGAGAPGDTGMAEALVITHLIGSLAGPTTASGTRHPDAAQHRLPSGVVVVPSRREHDREWTPLAISGQVQHDRQPAPTPDLTDCPFPDPGGLLVRPDFAAVDPDLPDDFPEGFGSDLDVGEQPIPRPATAHALRSVEDCRAYPGDGRFVRLNLVHHLCSWAHNHTSHSFCKVLFSHAVGTILMWDLKS